MRVVLTPIRAPNANAFCERWVGTVRAECLDWTLILGRRHLDRVLRTYIGHYNQARPHPGLGLQTPIGDPWPAVDDVRAASRRPSPTTSSPSSAASSGSASSKAPCGDAPMVRQPPGDGDRP